MDNFIRDLAKRTEDGEFGNWKERERNLGPLYGPVQNQVNRDLGYPKRYPSDYNWWK